MMVTTHSLGTQLMKPIEFIIEFVIEYVKDVFLIAWQNKFQILFISYQLM